MAEEKVKDGIDDSNPNFVVLTIDGASYKIAREINGKQYLELRRRSTRPTENGSGIEVEEGSFDFWNLFMRLLEPEMTEEELENLPRRVFNPLTLLAGKLDTEEAKGVADFLRANSSHFRMFPSISALTSDSPRPTSEATSE